VSGRASRPCRTTQRWETRGVEEQLKFLAQVHEIRRVILIAHVGCAYYSRRLVLPPERIEAEQRDDLQKALRAVQSILPGIDVALYVARVLDAKLVFEAL